MRREREQVLARDGYRCQLRFAGCAGRAEIDDHIVPLSEGGTDDLRNRQAVCASCHAVKTRAEQARGLRRYYDRARRPDPPHPGLMP